MTPKDWLLLLFSDSRKPLDRVRVQKAMFLFAERSKAPSDQKYAFRPYNYGPFSFRIYPDLERLVSERLLNAEVVPWLSSPVYSLTAKGERVVDELRNEAPPERLALLHRMREYVVERDFNTLLRDIYRLYPAYAKHSVFRS